MQHSPSICKSIRDHRASVPGIFVELDAGDIVPAELLKLAVAKEKKFITSKVYIQVGQKLTSGVNAGQRNSLSLSKDPDISVFVSHIEGMIFQQMSHIQEVLKIPPFRPGLCEASCVAFVKGSFFGQHRDSLGRHSGDRVLSWVYYFSDEPVPFVGGDLVFFKGKLELARIPARSGSLVVFRSDLLHQVEPVDCIDESFRKARFTLTGFIHSHPTITGSIMDSAYKFLSPLRRFRTARFAARLVRKLSSVLTN